MEIQIDRDMVCNYENLQLIKKYPRLYLLVEDTKLWVIKSYKKRIHAQREWDILVALRNLSFIPKAYAVCHEPSHSTLIMQYIPGMDLFEYTDRYGNFTETTLKPVLKSILMHLSTLHERDIIHKDIKPENILFHPPFIFLIDFEGKQTAGYRSPELYTHRISSTYSDIWALGITCFVLLTGYFPFETDLEATSKPLPVLSGWSVPFRNLIQTMLDKDPSRRSSAQELVSHRFFTN